jgi:hypothetical protein
MNRTSALVLLSAIAFSPFAAAQDASGGGSCRSISDNAARLHCYDSVFGAPAPQPMPPIAAVAPTTSRPAVAPALQVRPEQFGSENLADRAPQSPSVPDAPPTELDSIRAAITSTSHTGYGNLVVYLDNGQVWRQVESDGSAAPLLKPKEVVVITRGMIAGYLLTVEGRGGSYYVKRVK